MVVAPAPPFTVTPVHVAQEEATLAVLTQIASKDAFNHLRTQRQLGYVVQCGTRSIGRSRGISVLIQSSVMAPPDLEREIELWLAGFRQTSLGEMPAAAFAEFAESVAKSYEQPAKTLMQARACSSGVVGQRARVAELMSARHVPSHGAGGGGDGARACERL